MDPNGSVLKKNVNKPIIKGGSRLEICEDNQTPRKGSRFAKDDGDKN